MNIKDDLSILKQAKKMFIDTGKLNRRIVNDEISYSWYRSRVLEISNTKNNFKSHNTISSSDIEIGKIIKANNANISSENKLYNIYLINEHGMIIDELDKKFTINNFETNTYDDQIIGTNGIALSIKSNEHKYTVGYEHYNDILEEYFTYGFPIFKDDALICYVGIIGFVNDFDTSSIETIITKMNIDNEIHINETISSSTLIDEDFYFGQSKIGQLLKFESDRIASTNIDIIIKGESGSGKEMLARYIHNNSERMNFPFIALNAKSMIESMLVSDIRKWSSQKCTLYIENFDCLHEDLQADLIKFHDSKLKNSSSSDVARIIYSTERATFSNDFSIFYSKLKKRLLNTELEIENWVNRPNDLKEAIKKIFSKLCSDKFTNIDEKLIELIFNDYLESSYRELYRGILLMVNNSLEHKLLTVNSYIPKMRHSEDIKLLTLAELERDHIEKILNFCEHNMLQASKILGIGRSTLYRKVKEYEINSVSK